MTPQEEKIVQLEDALCRATSIGMSTILTRCGAFMDLSPYLKARYNELAAMRELCEAAFNRNIAKAEAEAPE